MVFNMPDVVALLPGKELFLLSIVINVAFARIFFQCHWIGDCIAAFYAGYAIVYLNSLISHAFVY
jgi:hypothetical protein